jgi:starch phosphorylase
MLLADLRSYIERRKSRCSLWDRETDRKSILNVARAGKFSSDRTIREYAADIWHIEPCEIAR